MTQLQPRARLRISPASRSCVWRSPLDRPFADDTVNIVEDDFGAKLSRVYSETDSEQCDRETTLQDLYSGQYYDPFRVVAFNTSEGWSRDVSYEFATEIQRRADLDRRELSGKLYTRPARQHRCGSDDLRNIGHNFETEKVLAKLVAKVTRPGR